MFKRYISLLTAFLIIFCTAFAEESGTVILTADDLAAIEENSDEVEAAPAVEACEEFHIAKALGLIENAAAEDKYITRGEAAFAAAGLLNIQEVKGSTAFEDVATSHSYYDAICTVNSLSIMTGYAGYFRPDDIITQEELAAVLVRTAGYSYPAAQSGGYSDGYLALAYKLGIFDGFENPEADKVHIQNFARALFNMLEVEPMNKVLGNEEKYELSGDTFLEIMGLCEITGIVTQNNITSLHSSDYADEGKAVIGNTKVITGDWDVSSMIGMSVKAYVTDTVRDHERMLYYIEDFDTKTVTVDFDDIYSIESIFNTMTVDYDDAGKRKTAKLDSGISVIYNGVYSNLRSKDLFENGCGKIQLISNDGDSTYECIKIDKYTDYVVDGVNKNLMLISDKTGKMLDLDMDNAHEVVITDTNGAALTLENIVEWNILSVYDSYVEGKTNKGTRYVKIVCSSQSVAGTIGEITDANGEHTVVIEEAQYEVSPMYTPGDSIFALDVGFNGIFYLNAAGLISAGREDQLNSFQRELGYLIAVDYKSFQDEVKYKIYTQSDEFITPTGAATIQIDGDAVKGASRYSYFVENDAVKNQIIKFELNDNGELKYVDTMVRGSSENENSLERVRSHTQGKLLWRDGPKTFNRKFNLTSNTIRFSIPSDLSKEDEFGTNFNLTVGEWYNFDAYTDGNPFELRVIVRMDAFSSSMTNSDINLVHQKKRVLGKDGEEYIRLHMYGTAEKNVNCELDTEGIDDIEPGDIIVYALNGSGRISAIRKVYDYGTHTQLIADTGFASDERVFGGQVYKKRGNWFSYTPDEITEGTANMTLETANRTYYKSWYYDAENEKVVAATAADILDYETYGDSCSRIVLADYADWGQVLVVYNE